MAVANIVLLVDGGLSVDDLGEPEVEHEHAPVLRQHHVVGFQVAMNDPFAVRRAQRLGHVGGDRARLGDLDRALGDALTQADALDDLHDDEHALVGLADLEHGHDVGMHHPCGRARLPHEARAALVIAHDRRRQHLDGDLAVQLWITRPIHLAHTASAEKRIDHEAAELGSGLERHGNTLAARRGDDTFSCHRHGRSVDNCRKWRKQPARRGRTVRALDAGESRGSA